MSKQRTVPQLLEEISAKDEAIQALARAVAIQDDKVPKKGRPIGRRNRSDYSQLTAYIPKALHNDVMRTVASLKYGDYPDIDMSLVVEELLADWVKG